MVAIETDAEKRVEGLTLLAAQGIKATLDLLDDFFRARRIGPRTNSRGRVRRVFIFDDDARIERVDAALGDGEFVLPFEHNAHLLFDKGELSLDGDTDFLFGVRRGSNGPDLLREIRRFSRYLLIERLKTWHLPP